MKKVGSLTSFPPFLFIKRDSLLLHELLVLEALRLFVAEAALLVFLVL